MKPSRNRAASAFAHPPSLGVAHGRLRLLVQGCVLLLAWLVLPAAAQALFRPHFTPVEPGQIPREVVASLAQDSAGFIWLGTGDGPVRFDGHQFRAIERADPLPGRRNLGWVQAMLASADGAVWLGSETAGLVRHDPRTDQVQTLGCGKASGQACPIIHALAQGPDGSVWVGTQGEGLQLFQAQPRKFVAQVLQPGLNGAVGLDVRALLTDQAGSLWVGSSAGLFRRRAGQTAFEPMLTALLAGHTATALLHTSDGAVWLGTQQGLLATVDPATGLGQALDQAPPHPQRARGQVNALAEAPKGQVWVGHSRGLDLWSTQQPQALQRLHYDPFDANGPGGHEVSGLLVGRDGWLWVATLGVGLQKHDPTNRAIQVLGPQHTPGHVLAQANVRSLLALQDGQLWLGTLAGDIALLDDQLRLRGQLRQAAALGQAPAGLRSDSDSGSGSGSGSGSDSGKRSGPSSPITAMAQTSSGAVWLGHDGGLLQLSPQGRLLATRRLQAGTPHRMFSSTDGSLWIMAQQGLFRLRAGAAQATLVQAHDTTGQAMRSGEMFTGLQSRDGRLWFGGHLGLFQFQPDTETLQAVASKPVLSTVLGLLEDQDGSLWLDSAVTGLHRLRGWRAGTAMLDPVSARHGSLNRPFGANLLQDGQGRIWTHMHVYDPRSDRLTRLGQADGVQFGTGRFHVMAQRADGSLFFGGSRGLLVVRPEAYQAQQLLPPLVASGLKVNGQTRAVASHPGPLVLAPQERAFSLEFAALAYQNQSALHYRYRLTGLDTRWQETGPSLRQAAYSNLAPGHYGLEVQVAAAPGEWRGAPLTLDLTVQAAWWQTPAFRFGLAMLGVLALALLVQWRTQALRRRQTELEKKVQERTQALQTMSAALEEASLSDPLTGLRNRRFLMRHMDAEIALLERCRAEALAQGRAPGADACLVFFMVDIDLFKQVNDEHGHAAGDAVLVQMRERLQHVFRAEDYLVRWGGEEFLIVARHTDHDAAAELAERACRAVFEQPFELGDAQPLQRSCSVGFACYPLLPEEPRALGWAATVELADAALYAAKRGGRNTWVGLRGAPGVAGHELRQMAEQPVGYCLQDPRWQLLRRPALG